MRKFDFSKINIPVVDISDEPESDPSTFGAPSGPAKGNTFVSGSIVTTIEEPPMKVSWIPADVPVTRENLLAALQVTEAEREQIWKYDQREPEWHRARAGRITGSRVGSAAGHNPYCDPEKLVYEWLYVPVKDNAAMKWGRDNEDPARNLYMDIKRGQNQHVKKATPFERMPSYIEDEYRLVDTEAIPVDPNEVSDLPYDIRVDVRGLVVHPEKCYIGYSSDGEVTETDDKGMLEIKCPRKM